jgi:SAM-dependent methyltransferase
MRFHDPELARPHRHLIDGLLAELRSFPWREVPCVVCGETERLEPAFAKYGVDYVRCGACEHLFVNPQMPEEAVPFLYGSRYWADYARATGCPTIEERLQFDFDNGVGKLHRDVLPFRGSGRLLDVGASSGGLVAQALRFGFEAEGLEPAPEICELARRAHGVTMHCGTLVEQRFPAASWDVITMHDVLEHLVEPTRELCELRRVLAPGGLLVIETASTSSLELVERGADWFLVSPLEHPHLFGERNGARLLRRSGFTILDLYSPHEHNWIAIAEAR